MLFSQEIASVLKWGRTEVATIGATIDCIRTYPFLSYLSIFSNSSARSKVMRALSSTTMKSGQTKGSVANGSLSLSLLRLSYLALLVVSEENDMVWIDPISISSNHASILY